MPLKPRHWDYLTITKYQKNYYFNLCAQRLELCYPEEKDRIDWDSEEVSGLIRCLSLTIKQQIKDPKNYLKKLNQNLPLRYRDGIIPRNWLIRWVPDLYRPEKILGARNTAKLCHHLEKSKDGAAEKFLPEMTLTTYLSYCKEAYLANAKSLKFSRESKALELYKQFADNRNDGLLDIDPNSPVAFSQWYHGSRGGGHPWEIYRGGNTTHIDLGVRFEENKGWIIYLNSEATSRLVETARIALGFIEKDLPFELLNGKSIRMKLHNLDNIGLVPDWHSTHRAASEFPDEFHVYDCIHLRNLETREEKKVISLATWFPLDLNLPPV